MHRLQKALQEILDQGEYGGNPAHLMRIIDETFKDGSDADLQQSPLELDEDLLSMLLTDESCLVATTLLIKLLDVAQKNPGQVISGPSTEWGDLVNALLSNHQLKKQLEKQLKEQLEGRLEEPLRERYKLLCFSMIDLNSNPVNIAQLRASLCDDDDSDHMERREYLVNCLEKRQKDRAGNAGRAAAAIAAMAKHEASCVMEQCLGLEMALSSRFQTQEDVARGAMPFGFRGSE
jgi:hypothetical protein